MDKSWLVVDRSLLVVFVTPPSSFQVANMDEEDEEEDENWSAKNVEEVEYENENDVKRRKKDIL